MRCPNHQQPGGTTYTTVGREQRWYCDHHWDQALDYIDMRHRQSQLQPQREAEQSPQAQPRRWQWTLMTMIYAFIFVSVLQILIIRGLSDQVDDDSIKERSAIAWIQYGRISLFLALFKALYTWFFGAP